MTREEAIEVLQASSIKQLSHTKIIVDGKFLSVKVALDMAIEALEQEPITDRIEYGTDGNSYKLTISNGKEFKQEPVLDKIRAEIMQLYNEVEVVDYDHNDISRIKRAHWIIREEVLWIIDKYNSCPKRGVDMREGD